MRATLWHMFVITHYIYVYAARLEAERTPCEREKSESETDVRMCIHNNIIVVQMRHAIIRQQT